MVYLDLNKESIINPKQHLLKFFKPIFVVFDDGIGLLLQNPDSTKTKVR